MGIARPGQSSGPLAASGVPADLAGQLDRHWASSRSGAVAGRGYHYQDFVGAWVALRMLAGETSGEQLIVEGFDDLSCEDVAASHHVQVKSRQQRVGDFRAGEAAGHMVDAWMRHRQRPDSNGPMTVVLERAVAGQQARLWGRPIIAEPGWALVVDAARLKAGTFGWSAAEVDEMLARTSLLVLPQRVLAADCAALVARRTGLPLGATTPVVQAVRAAVAAAADKNAAATQWADRAGLTRTQLERLVTEAARQVDQAALLEALTSGICQPVDFDSALPGQAFYTGIAVQPGHIAAGLVVPRPAETEQVLAGLRSGRAVLIAGPSGVGKSAVAWMAACVGRHAIWYQVHRLQPADVETIIRLALAAGAGQYGPVGLVVDGVGTGSLTAWDQLQRRAAATPGVMLLGSVREEDTLPLETLADVVVVRPRLDDQLAARIHAALRESGATSQAHWREALQQSQGLTMEFTHLLTQGARLSQVVAEQVRARVRDTGRATELAVLAPVSASHRWGASLSVDALTLAVGASAGDLRRALGRLTDEHLVHVDRGLVDGLHPLRSAAICDAVHRHPPPTLPETVRQVLSHLPVDQLERFVGRAVADQPELGEVVVDTLCSLLADPATRSLRIAAAALAGLRLADFTVEARSWVEVLRRCRVSLPLQPLAVDLAMTDSDLAGGFDEALVAAVSEIRAARDEKVSPLRDRLLRRCGPGALAELVEGAADLDEVAAVLAPLAYSGIDITSSDSALGAIFEAAPLEQIGRVVAAAAAVSPGSGQAMLAAAGGQLRLVDRMLEANPWLLDLEVVIEDGDRVVRGRVLFVSDQVNPNPERYVKDLAAMSLRCLDADRADLATVFTGGARYSIDGYEFAYSGLLRRYAAGPATITWNRMRSRFARALLAAPSTTEHLAAGFDLLLRVERFLSKLLEAWIRPGTNKQEYLRLDWQRRDLAAAVDRLAPPRPEADDDDPARADPIHGLVHGIVQNLAGRLSDQAGYRALAMFAADTLRGHARSARKQPWELLGLEQPPEGLDRIDAMLADLAAVVDELGVDQEALVPLTLAAISVRPGGGLAAAASHAAERAERRYRESVDAVLADATEQGIAMTTCTRDEPAPESWLRPALHTAFLVDIETTRFDAAVAALPELLDRYPLPEATVLLVPQHQALILKPFIRSVSASGKVYPAGASTEPWLEHLPSAQDLPATAAVTSALTSLYELSAIAYRNSQRPKALEPNHQVVNRAVEQLEEASSSFMELPQDDVTAELAEALDGLLKQVQTELDGVHEGEYLAELIDQVSPGQSATSAVSALIGAALDRDLEAVIAG